MRILLLAVLAGFGVVDTTTLTVDRHKHEDTVYYPTVDPAVSYAVIQIEAASLRPFCLSVERIGFSECYRAGYVKRSIAVQARAGHEGEAIGLTLKSPITNDPETTHALVRMVITENGVSP